MADPVALRVRRSRAHAAGDHSLCKRCVVVRAGAGKDAASRLAALPAPAPGAGAPKLSPRAEMEELALRLIAAHKDDPPNTLLARELRMTLAELLPKGKPNQDEDLTGLFSALQA